MKQNPTSQFPVRDHVRVWVDGCFDLTHFGHANALRQAKGLGDQLVVGVHSDEDIKLHKGPPVFSEQERYRLIGAIKWVDQLVEGAPYVTTLETLRKHSCDFAAHGDDVTFTSDGSDPYHMVKVAGCYKEFKRTEGISTTELLSRILKRMESLEENQVHSGSPHRVKLLRRSRSVDSFLVTSLASLQNQTTHSETNQNHAAVNTADSPTQSDFGWTNCGIPYMPNTLRITQFSMGSLDSYGLREPGPDDVVVYAPGAFDLFHIGHLSFLEKCLDLGNYILIGLHSDSTATYENRRLGTILTLQERLLSVLACRYVCNVVIDAPYKITGRFLDHFKVNYVVVGKDTELRLLTNGEDPMKIPKQRGIFRRIDSGSDVTTSSVVARILKNRFDYEKRNLSKEARESEAITSLNRTSEGLCL
ncbi:hypothetical protein CRM22_004036 [Opisthorchis felineus]|uniref:ethanolamine-phosphate cytidylyltransferase n=1 Tax=Opisthorchis felineus TaxID=147828 RepID=A0A4S2M4E3_OPIFE|nr:hypothetical protein CRM22_004036 [Opisthorchis felineus]